jgi:hypothetical protein
MDRPRPQDECLVGLIDRGRTDVMEFAPATARQEARHLPKRMTAAVLDAGKLIQSDLSVFDQYPKPHDLNNPEEIAAAKKSLAPVFSPRNGGPALVTNAYHLVERAAALGVISKAARDFIVAL